MPELGQFAKDFASAIETVDSKSPQAVNARTGVSFQPGIGPHSEAATVSLVMSQLSHQAAQAYDSYAVSVPYPQLLRQRCDLCIGTTDKWTWAVEVKMLRLLGDNGKPNDNMLMHILSPYPAHRSAVSDCEKLATSGFAARKAILIYGYDYEDWPLEPVIAAFETLAQRQVRLGDRCEAPFANLIHPIHQRGAVFAWELLPA